MTENTEKILKLEIPKLSKELFDIAQKLGSLYETINLDDYYENYEKEEI